MNQQSITTPDQTVTLQYTLPYIIYNLIYFHNYYIIGIPVYSINFEFTFYCSISFDVFHHYTIRLYYITPTFKKNIYMILSCMATM